MVKINHVSTRGDTGTEEKNNHYLLNKLKRLFKFHHQYCHKVLDENMAFLVIILIIH